MGEIPGESVCCLSVALLFEIAIFFVLSVFFFISGWGRRVRRGGVELVRRLCLERSEGFVDYSCSLSIVTR